MPFWNFWIDNWVNFRGIAVRSTSEFGAGAFVDDFLCFASMVFSHDLKGIFYGWHISGTFLVEEGGFTPLLPILPKNNVFLDVLRFDAGPVESLIPFSFYFGVLYKVFFVES